MSLFLALVKSSGQILPYLQLHIEDQKFLSMQLPSQALFDPSGDYLSLAESQNSMGPCLYVNL